MTKRAWGAATALLLTAGLLSSIPAVATASPAEDSQEALNELARDLERVESVREIKDAQRQYTHFAQFGQFDDMADLFADDGVLQWGAETATGRAAIEDWLVAEAGGSDGIQPGSLNTLVIDQPLVNLSVDGLSAQVRWNGLRFTGDGEGAARIEGGIYENEYVLEGGEWRISLLHYYPLYEGDYATGWRNVDLALLPLVPYHFTPESSGIPIPEPEGAAPATDLTAEELALRIDRLNDEDAVRNLQHAYGYYVDQRMWSDVVDLFVADSTVTIDGVGSYSGAAGVRQAMERMGPEGLSQGILNERPIFDTIVEISPDGLTAVARGLEFAMVGDANTRAASWEFTVFRNEFVKVNGLWMLKELHLTPLMVAPYVGGWGDGGTFSQTGVVPAFLDAGDRGERAVSGDAPTTDLVDLARRLLRSAAYDGTENASAAYTAYLDDLRIYDMAAIHAEFGHKLSPFAGYFQGPERVAQAGVTVYGTNPSTMRSSLSLHWRPQAVIIVSHDGESSSLRARLLQPRTNRTTAGTFNGAMYNDQFVLEDGSWKIWSLTIDEFYWQSVNWAGGWAAANPRNPALPDPAPSTLVTRYPPDVLHSSLGIRSAGFQGGSGGYLQWPAIVPMWFHYQNPVTGRMPANFWADCAPCEVRPDWKLTEHGYQLPPTGPQIDGWALDWAAVNTAAPSISGDAIVGQTLTASPGTWNVAGLDFAYQWLRDGEPIAGATAATYVVVVADAGHDLSVAVTASEPGRAAATAESGGVAATHPAYSSSAVYTGGQYVAYNGAVFYAQWWTSGETPGASPWGAWAEVGVPVTCTTGTYPDWTASWTYTGGETVAEAGKVWTAQWWTRNQVPGTPYGPWLEVGVC